MSVSNTNPNKATIQVHNNTVFPAVPSQWTNRVDINIWNELKSVSNDAVRGITPNKRKSVGTYISCTFCWIFFFLWFLPVSGGGIFFWLDVCLIIIMLMALYYDCCHYKRKYAQTIPVITERIQLHFISLNQKYGNMIVFTVLSVHNPPKDACIASVGGASNCIHFELEIEIKVQQISYIADAKRVNILPTQQSFHVQQPVQSVASLPTQQQIQTAISFPAQQSVQIVSSLPVQQQMTGSVPGAGFAVNVNGFQQKHYTQWNTKDLLDWIMHLENGMFASCQPQLGKTLAAEQIDGNDIFDLDKDDLHRLGIENFKLKKCLLNHIKSLSEPEPIAAYTVDMESDAPSAPGMNEGAVTNM